jgi:hypothetical protein
MLSTFDTILEIKERVIPNRLLPQKRDTFLHNYITGLNDCRNKIFIDAEVHKDSLDTGKYLKIDLIRS